MPDLLAPGLVAADSSDDDESHLAPLAETGLPGEDEQEDSPIDQDLYGFAIRALLRDSNPMSVGDKGTKKFRFYRLLLALGTLFLSMGVQLFLLIETKAFLTSKAVHDIREVYSRFQVHMYGDDPSHMEKTVNGYWRGKPEFFQPDLFESLDPDIQSIACKISLSQPRFLVLVLFIWTLACAGEIRGAWELFRTLVVQLPTVSKSSLQLAVPTRPDEQDVYQNALYRLQGFGFSEDQANGVCVMILEQRAWVAKRNREGEKVLIIAGLTSCMKVVVSVFVLLPRLVLNCVLLWLGSRWITATTDFDQLLLNSVALHFIVNLKDLVYHLCISSRGKVELERTRMSAPPRSQQEPTCCIFMGTFLWGFSALAWALLYMHWLQRVLPEYRWDVHGVCQKLIEDYSA